MSDLEVAPIAFSHAIAILEDDNKRIRAGIRRVSDMRHFERDAIYTMGDNDPNNNVGRYILRGAELLKRTGHPTDELLHPLGDLTLRRRSYMESERVDMQSRIDATLNGKSELHRLKSTYMIKVDKWISMNNDLMNQMDVTLGGYLPDRSKETPTTSIFSNCRATEVNNIIEVIE